MLKDTRYNWQHRDRALVIHVKLVLLFINWRIIACFHAFGNCPLTIDTLNILVTSAMPLDDKPQHISWWAIRAIGTRQLKYWEHAQLQLETELKANLVLAEVKTVVRWLNEEWDNSRRDQVLIDCISWCLTDSNALYSYDIIDTLARPRPVHDDLLPESQEFDLTQCAKKLFLTRNKTKMYQFLS